MGWVGNEILSAALLFGGILALGEVGRAFGSRRSAGANASQPGQRAIEGIVLSLLGLLLAFTFSGAATRFDARKTLAIDEANAIGTAYLRLDLLPAEERGAEQALLSRYLDSRIAIYRALPDVDAAMKEYARAQALQGELWRRAVATARTQPQIGIVLLPALNAMFDIASTRLATLRIHPPAVVFWMLDGVALVCALLLGYALAGSTPSGRPHLVVFGVVITITIFIIGDFEHPLVGFIRNRDGDQLLIRLRGSL